MTKEPHSLSASLFYSYSHKDVQHKMDMENALSLLRQHGYIKEWSDREIPAGQSISDDLQRELPDSDIIVFLLSPDFLDSEACCAEWNSAKELVSSGNVVFRVPIIVRPCAWQDFLGEDDVKALPLDGKPITSYEDRDEAWLEVYEGIKLVVEKVRITHTPRASFVDELNDSELPSSSKILLDDIFVFPHLVENSITANDLRQTTVSSVSDLIEMKRVVVHGQDKSGKTALAKHLALSCLQRGDPVLLADVNQVAGRVDKRLIRRLHHDQYHGDYLLWQQQDEKTLIVDNMTEAPGLLGFIADCSDDFDRIFVFVSSDIFRSFLSDEPRLTAFRRISIEPMLFDTQEVLIRKRLATINGTDPLTDAFIDRVEDHVDSVIISNRVVPRYPFFVLSILQTYDGQVAYHLPITSYGHCYYVFIIASLHRADVSVTDESLNACINFLERLALAHFELRHSASDERVNFKNFLSQYELDYILPDSLTNRLTHSDFGILTPDGEFKTDYMYYFFLGKLLATNSDLAEKYLPDLCDRSYAQENHLTILFAIHHASDERIIEDIIDRTKVELVDVAVATLREDETSRFSDIVSDLPESVLSDASVEEERARQRQAKNDQGSFDDGESEDDDEDEISVAMLRVLKNSKILGQVLRNQSGKLRKQRIEQIVETIGDSCFRLVNAILKDEDEIRGVAHALHSRMPQADLDQVQQFVRIWSFVWTMNCVEEAVHAVSVPSIRETINAVVERKATPAYEIFGYFYLLDNASALSVTIRDRLRDLFDRYDDYFVKRVLSIRTQWYMNTHDSKTSIEQSIFNVLQIPYRPRLKAGSPRALQR